jgi:hypothetical protein
VSRLRRRDDVEAAELDAELGDDGPPAEWLDRWTRSFQRPLAYDPALDPDGAGPPRVSVADARAQALRLWKGSTTRRDLRKR